MFVNVDSVAENVFVGYVEADIIHLHRYLASVFLIEQHADLQALRLARLEHLQNVCQRAPAVHDVLNQQHIQAFNVGHQVKVDAHISAGGIMPDPIGGE